jgi:hypothetical protein
MIGVVQTTEVQTGGLRAQGVMRYAVAAVAMLESSSSLGLEGTELVLKLWIHLEESTMSVKRHQT